MLPRLPLVLLLVLASTGCYVIPPLRAGGAGGGAAGEVVTREPPGDTAAHAGAGVTELHVGLTPLTLKEGALGRRHDLSLGWTFAWTHPTRGRSELDHGPYAEAAWFVRGASPYPGLRWRLAPTARVEYFYPRDVEPRFGVDTETDPGYGASLGLLYELVDERRGGGLYPGAYGAHQGEVGFGVAVRAGLRSLDAGVAAFAVLSIELRSPGMIGVAIPLEPSRQW